MSTSSVLDPVRPSSATNGSRESSQETGSSSRRVEISDTLSVTFTYPDPKKLNLLHIEILINTRESYDATMGKINSLLTDMAGLFPITDGKKIEIVDAPKEHLRAPTPEHRLRTISFTIIGTEELGIRMELHLERKAQQLFNNALFNLEGAAPLTK